MFMGQAVLLTLKRQAHVSEVLVLNAGNEMKCFTDWCWWGIPHGGSKRSINGVQLPRFTHTHMHFTVFFPPRNL